jgi:hypothetical protein
MPVQNSDVTVALQHVLGVRLVGASSCVRCARKAGSVSIDAVLPFLLVALDMAIPFIFFFVRYIVS